MLFIYVFGLFIAGSIAMGILALYGMARQKSSAYRRGRQRYDFLINDLGKLKGQVETEADRWPIYARPVMFTEIDHDAQLEFARAQQAVQDADRIVPEIETIPEPETPEAFDLRSVFQVSKNLRTINIGNQLVGNVSSLENQVGNLTNSVKTIRIDWYKTVKKRREVRVAVKELKTKIEDVSPGRASMDSWNSNTIYQVTWARDVAEKCHAAAHVQIGKESEDEQGYLEHAIADVYVEIGLFALGYIHLLLESQSVSARYNLDLFNNLFKDTADYLQSILLMGEWNGWRKLRHAKTYIDLFPETRNMAIRSLESFKEYRDQLELGIKQIGELDLPKQIEETNKLQDVCTYYWYSFEERKADWLRILQDQPLPSIGLNKIQSELVGDILPAIGTDMVIQQSIMPSLIEKIQALLHNISVVQAVIYRLRMELDRHQNAQKIVSTHLAAGGAAYQARNRLDEVLKDTSPDIGEHGTRLLTIYKGYDERNTKVRGANFPGLQEEVDDLVVDIHNVISQHVLLLSKLEADYRTLFQAIKADLQKIDDYMRHTPAFDKEMQKAFQNFFTSGLEILNHATPKGYSLLTGATNKMNMWLNTSQPYLVSAEDRHKAFATAQDQAERQFRKAKEQILVQRIVAQRKWTWIRQEIMLLIDHAELELDHENNELRLVGERKWAEFTIYKAIERCDNWVNFADQRLVDLTKRIGKFVQQQQSLTDNATDIKRTAHSNSKKISEEDQRQIKVLLELAITSKTKEAAERLLKHADALASTRADWNERSAIKTIVYNVNTSGGAYVGGGVNTGGGSFIGKDQIS